MTRVGIITYHFSDNYGALFQAYSLRQWFLQRGVDAEFINYHPRYVEEGGDFVGLLKRRNARKNLVIAYLKVSHTIWRVLGNADQKNSFDRFRREYLGVAGRRLQTAEDMTSLDGFALLVCGSDQIWSPSAQKGLDPVYFLDFPGAAKARRISYAPSFGRSEIPAEVHAEAGRWIGDLDAVSVREESGVGIVRSVAAREAACVPDPTILLGDFEEILAGPALPEGHVFCYALRTSEVIRKVALHVGALAGNGVVSPITARQRWRPIGQGIIPGPQEWLRLLAGASTVVTNSFHGVALSIVLNRPFLAVALPGGKDAMNLRTLNLLGQAGLQARLVRSDDPKEVDAALAAPIDWDAVNGRMARLRKAGTDFLDAQLDHVERRHGPRRAAGL